MSPRPADPAVRIALIEAAARIVAEEGRAGLTLRGLAAEVGTSTMAIYTHFGSMDELRRAVRVEGFARLRDRMDAVGRTADSVADLIVGGAAYYEVATSAPNLYRAMFLDRPADDVDLTTGLDTFGQLVELVARCCDAGRFPLAPFDEPASLALEIWARMHGFVSLQVAHLLPADEVVAHLDQSHRTMFVGWGDDPAAQARSWRTAQRRIGQVAAAADARAGAAAGRRARGQGRAAG